MEAVAVADGAGATCANTNEASTGTYSIACGFGPLEPGGTRTVNATFFGRRSDIQPPYLLTWRTTFDFNSVVGEAPGSLCFPPAGQPDCSSLTP